MTPFSIPVVCQSEDSWNIISYWYEHVLITSVYIIYKCRGTPFNERGFPGTSDIVLYLFACRAWSVFIIVYLSCI